MNWSMNRFMDISLRGCLLSSVDGCVHLFDVFGNFHRASYNYLFSLMFACFCLRDVYRLTLCWCCLNKYFGCFVAFLGLSPCHKQSWPPRWVRPWAWISDAVSDTFSDELFNPSFHQSVNGSMHQSENLMIQRCSLFWYINPSSYRAINPSIHLSFHVSMMNALFH